MGFVGIVFKCIFRDICIMYIKKLKIKYNIWLILLIIKKTNIKFLVR